MNAVVRVDGKAYKRGESLHVLQVIQVIHIAYWGSCAQKSVFRDLRVLLRLDGFSTPSNLRVLAVSLSFLHVHNWVITQMPPSVWLTVTRTSFRLDRRHPCSGRFVTEYEGGI